MSVPEISRLSPLASAAGAAPAPAAAGAAPTTSAAGFQATLDAVTNDVLPASPPSEVRDAIGVAAGAWQRLADAGESVRFQLDPPAGRVSAALTDAIGGAHPLTGAQVLSLAAGEQPGGAR